MKTIERHQTFELRHRLQEPSHQLIVVSGPRQVGKTTMVRQVLGGQLHDFWAADDNHSASHSNWQDSQTTSHRVAGTPPTAQQLAQHWQQARKKAIALNNQNPQAPCFVLVIDEIQKIKHWSEVVKGLWDADRAQNIPLHVVLLGSSPWLMQKGLTESLAGRFELIRMPHWSYQEMQDAFDFSLNEYIYFGGYPGSAKILRDKGEARWRSYVRDSLISPAINNDILQMVRVDKPALLKRLFELGCGCYFARIMALNKVLGNLHEAGNTTTLTHYLELLSRSWLLTGLQKATDALRQRKAPPKFIPHNTALISAQSDYSFAEAQNDRSHWGRLVESAVGAHFINHQPEDYQLLYWRDGGQEVDFVLQRGQKRVAIEVKSSINKSPRQGGLQAFQAQFPSAKLCVVGGQDGIPLADFLLRPVAFLLE